MGCDGNCARKQGEKEGGLAPYLFGALGALAALAVVAKRTQLRPWIKATLREAHGFKEWASLHAQEAREDFEDIAAEAKEDHKNDLKRRLDENERQHALLKKLAAKGASPKAGKANDRG